ncbi:MAG: TetR/AcrR family transcriptional regulator [Treponema sp.]|nr:TetR/AcrR family transcriptional regulator [Treponema sp.]
MPRNKHPEETIKKILDVSLELFLEKGYEQTTVLDIVANLGGLTRGAFYHHFKTKEDVLNALLEKYFTENAPFERVKGEKGLNGLGKLTKAMNNMLTVEKNVGITKTAQALLSVSNPRFLARLLQSNREVAPILQSLIEEGIEDGSIKPGNARLLTELFILLVHFWTFPTIFPDTREVFGEKVLIIKQILDTLGLPCLDESFMEKHEIWAELLNITPEA